MDLVCEQDPDAFGVILERHADAAYSLAYRILGNSEAAEDVLQEAFLSLWRRGGYDRSKGSVRTWILSIVHHRAVDTLRRGAARPTFTFDAEEVLRNQPAAERPFELVAHKESSRRLRSALEVLPPQQRKVIELAYFGGFTHAEIAAMTQEPIGTVKGRMRLGLQKLREELKEEVW